MESAVELAITSALLRVRPVVSAPPKAFVLVPIPTVLPRIAFPRVERPVTFNVFEDNPPPKVLVPDPLATVIAPPKVDVAVEVEIIFPTTV